MARTLMDHSRSDGDAGGDSPAVDTLRSKGDRPGGRDSGPSRLDKNTINGTVHAGEDLLVMDCKCRSWVCPRCGPGYWGSVSARVLPHLGMFRRPKLLTLTFDRKRFASGQEAYRYVKDNGLIRRFLRLMGFRKAFAVLAFHPGDREWAHWHILVDLADCGGWVDLKRGWRLWRDQWGTGGFDLNTKRGLGTAMQAARYALSYCQRQSGVGEWVKDSTRAPRAFEVYGDLRAAMRAARVAEQAAKDEGRDDAVENEDAADAEGVCTGERQPRTVRERLAECGRGSAVLLRRVCASGHTRYRYMGRLAARPAAFALADHLGKLRSLPIVRQTRELVSGTTVLDVMVPVAAGQDPRKLFERLERAALSLLHDETVDPPLRPALAMDVVGDEVAPF